MTDYENIFFPFGKFEKKKRFFVEKKDVDFPIYNRRTFYDRKTVYLIKLCRLFSVVQSQYVYATGIYKSP